MSQYIRSNMTFTLPKPDGFKVPTTLSEFQSMNYTERIYLLKNYPVAYQKFSSQSERKPWER